MTVVSSSEDDTDEDLPIPPKPITPFVIAGPSTNPAIIPLGLKMRPSWVRVYPSEPEVGIGPN